MTDCGAEREVDGSYDEAAALDISFSSSLAVGKLRGEGEKDIIKKKKENKK